MPHLQKQKKDYILSWWRQAAARRGHIASLHAMSSPRPPPLAQPPPSPYQQQPPPSPSPRGPSLIASPAQPSARSANPLLLGTQAYYSDSPRGADGSPPPGSAATFAAALLLSAQQHASIRRLLGTFGAADAGSDGTPELRVPTEMLQIVCSQVEDVVGDKPPRQPRARREWLATLATAAQQG